MACFAPSRDQKQSRILKAVVAIAPVFNKANITQKNTISWIDKKRVFTCTGLEMEAISLINHPHWRFQGGMGLKPLYPPETNSMISYKYLAMDSPLMESA